MTRGDSRGPANDKDDQVPVPRAKPLSHKLTSEQGLPHFCLRSIVHKLLLGAGRGKGATVGDGIFFYVRASRCRTI